MTGPFKFNRRMTKRRVHDNPLFCFWEDAICALSFFVRFSEKPGFCGYFLGVRTLFKGRRTKTASIGSVATLPANGLCFFDGWYSSCLSMCGKNGFRYAAGLEQTEAKQNGIAHTAPDCAGYVVGGSDLLDQHRINPNNHHD